MSDRPAVEPAACGHPPAAAHWEGPVLICNECGAERGGLSRQPSTRTAEPRWADRHQHEGVWFVREAEAAAPAGLDVLRRLVDSMGEHGASWKALDDARAFLAVSVTPACSKASAMTDRTAEPRTAAERLYRAYWLAAWEQDTRRTMVQWEQLDEAHRALWQAVAEAAAPAGLDVDVLTKALKVLHGDNVPLYARGVVTTPEDYAAKIVDCARLLQGKRDDE